MWQEFLLILMLAFVALAVYFAWTVAERKGRNREMWAVLTFFVLPALLVLIALPDQRTRPR